MNRKILHLDLDAFYCAVEEQRNPKLIGKPFAVGGHPNERGVVASCSYAARHYGVRSAMPMAKALSLCPNLAVISPHGGEYSKVSRQVMDILYEITPLVEQLSIDEAFLDTSALDQPAEITARELQSLVRNELGLPCSIGVATNKLLAKTANDIGKVSVKGSSPPNAITVVPAGGESEFLAPLPVRALWGIGPKTAERLATIKIHTIGELAIFSPNRLGKIFGKLGYDISRRAQGIDERPLVTTHEPKSFSQEITFARDISDEMQLLDTIQKLSTRVSSRLKKSGYCGKTVKLKLRWSDFTTLSRQSTLLTPTDQYAVIGNVATKLFQKEWLDVRPVRLLGVGVAGLGPPIQQLNLWDDASNGERESLINNDLEEALKILRQRFGEDVIQFAGEIGTRKYNKMDDSASP